MNPDRTAAAATRGGRMWLAASTAALLATVLGWPAGEAAIGSIPTETESAIVNGAEKSQVTVLSSYRTEVKRATLAHGLEAALLGMCLGLGGAMARRSAGAAAAAAIIGLILGGAAGAGGSFGLFPVYFRRLDPISGDLLLPLLIHGSLGAAIGVSCGLAFGIGRGGGPGRVALAAVGGLAGGSLGALAYQLLGAFCFPQSQTDLPVAADPSARLMAVALTGLCTAWGAAGAGRAARRPEPPGERPAEGPGPRTA